MNIVINADNVSNDKNSTVEISEKELGKAFLQFVVNAAGDEIGEKMINYFSKIALKNIESLFDDETIKKDSALISDNNSEILSCVNEEEAISEIKDAAGEIIGSHINDCIDKKIEQVDVAKSEEVVEVVNDESAYKIQSKENAKRGFIVEKLKDTAISQIKLNELKKNFSKLYSKITKDGKYSVPKQMASLCSIQLMFEDSISCSIIKPNGDEVKPNGEILYNNYDEIDEDILEELLLITEM